MTQPSQEQPTNVVMLAGMPETPTEHVEPNAGHLVAAWCESWTTAHNGRQPDASVVRRVAGICRQIARDRTDVESWREAWRAAKSAGSRGRFDIVSELCAPTVIAGRQNHYLELARQPAAGSISAQLEASLAPRQLEA